MYKSIVLTMIVVLAVSTVASASFPNQGGYNFGRRSSPMQSQTTYASASRVTSIWGTGAAGNYDNSNSSASQGMITRGGAGYQTASSSTTGSSWASSLWGSITSWFGGSAGTQQVQRF